VLQQKDARLQGSTLPAFFMQIGTYRRHFPGDLSAGSGWPVVYW
jgi:hypothetical protein